MPQDNVSSLPTAEKRKRQDAGDDDKEDANVSRALDNSTMNGDNVHAGAPDHVPPSQRDEAIDSLTREIVDDVTAWMQKGVEPPSASVPLAAAMQQAIVTALEVRQKKARMVQAVSMPTPIYSGSQAATASTRQPSASTRQPSRGKNRSTKKSTVFCGADVDFLKLQRFVARRGGYEVGPAHGCCSTCRTLLDGNHHHFLHNAHARWTSKLFLSFSTCTGRLSFVTNLHVIPPSCSLFLFSLSCAGSDKTAAVETSGRGHAVP